MKANRGEHVKGQVEVATVSFRLEPDKHERLKSIVAGERRSVSQTLALLVDRYLAEQDEQPDQLAA